MEEQQKIAKFEQDLRKVLKEMKKVRRWKHHKTASHENILEHSFKQSLIVQLLFGLEQWQGNPHQLDGYRLLQCAINHDLGEIITDDIWWEIKNGADKAKYEKKEREAFEEIRNRLIPTALHHYFPLPIDLSDSFSALEKEFWQAAEAIGYLYFALEELRENPDNPDHVKDFQRVFDNFDKEKGILKEAMKKFGSIAIVGRIILEKKEEIFYSTPLTPI